MLARIIGPLLVITALSMVTNRSGYRAIMEEFAGSPLAIYFTGVLALTLGLLIVEFHNVWVWGWPAIITLLGWGSVVKGALRILFPGLTQSTTVKFIENETLFIAGIGFILLVGAWLSYAGWIT